MPGLFCFLINLLAELEFRLCSGYASSFFFGSDSFEQLPLTPFASPRYHRFASKQFIFPATPLPRGGIMSSLILLTALSTGTVGFGPPDCCPPPPCCCPKVICFNICPPTAPCPPCVPPCPRVSFSSLTPPCPPVPCRPCIGVCPPAPPCPPVPAFCPCPH